MDAFLKRKHQKNWEITPQLTSARVRVTLVYDWLSMGVFLLGSKTAGEYIASMVDRKP